MEQLNLELRDFIVENFLFGEEVSFSDTDSFLKQGIIDSTGVVEVIAFIEEHYGIKVEDDEIVPDNLDSIERLSRFIEQKTKITQRDRNQIHAS
jgi:acyl carrier protein